MKFKSLNRVQDLPIDWANYPAQYAIDFFTSFWKLRLLSAKRPLTTAWCELSFEQAGIALGACVGSGMSHGLKPSNKGANGMLAILMDTLVALEPEVVDILNNPKKH